MPTDHDDEYDETTDDGDEDGEVIDMEPAPAPAPAPPPRGLGASPRANGSNGTNGHAAHPDDAPAVPRKRGRPPRAQGTGAVPSPPAPKLFGAEPPEQFAHLMWGQMLDRLKAENVHPSRVKIFVTRIDPAPQVPIGDFTGDCVPNGASDFYSYMVNNYHAKMSVKGPATYSCRFTWSGTGKFVKTGTLPLPPMEELIGMGAPRAYGAQGSMAGAPYAQPNYPPYGQPAYAPPPGPPLGYFPQQQAWGVPPQQQAAASQPQPAQAPQAPQGFGAPPVDPQVADLRAQVGFLSGQLQSVLEALSRQGAPGAAVAAAAAAAQPPPQQSAAGLAGPPTVDQIATAVLRMMGHTPVTQAQAQATPPPAAAAAAGLAEIKSMVDTFKSLRGVFRDFDDAFQPDEPPPEPQPIVAAPAEGASLPFDLIELPVPIFGHKGQYARNKETGNFDWQGFLLQNPGLAEKGMEVLGKAAEGLQAIGKNFGIGGAPKDAAPAASPLDESGLDFGDDAPGTLGGGSPEGWPET